MSEYAFEGQVVKLNQAHYDKWQEMYPCVELKEELEQLDMVFVIRQQETGKPVKNWFSECFERLNGRNKRGANERRANHNRPAGRQGHAAIVRGQAQRAIQRIDAQAGDPTIYPLG